MRFKQKLMSAVSEDFDKNWVISIVIFVLTLIPLVYGFWRFPKMMGDEGIYVSQAWWLAEFHKLGPYTYWYDHFPLGWAVIGIWQQLVGGPFAFGSSVVTGRLLMILLASVSNVFLFRLIYKLTKSGYVSFVMMIVFAFSPMMVLYHRMVLLDNIASFWLISSLYVFFSNPKKGLHVWLASILMVLGVLTKESLLFVVPPFLFAVLYINQNNRNRWYLWLLSLFTFLFWIGFFPLLAYLKSELTVGAGHESLLGTIGYQLGRGVGYPFWDVRSNFYQRTLIWLELDSFLLLVGIGATLVNLLFYFKNKIFLSFAVMALHFLLFFVRGGLVFDFHFIPLLTLLCIQIGLWLSAFLRELDALMFIEKYLSIWFGSLALLISIFLYQGDFLYLVDATYLQNEAVAKLDSIEDKDAVIVTDVFPFLDLRLERDGQEVKFTNIEWYSKAERDPEVYIDKLQLSNSNIDYLMMNNSLEYEFESGYDEYQFLTDAKKEMKEIWRLETEQPEAYKKIFETTFYDVDTLTLYKNEREDPSAVIDEEIKAVIASLSVKQKVGQMLMTVISNTALTENEAVMLKNGELGGVFLLQKNIQNQDQLTLLTQSIKSSSINGLTPFIAVDQEGGQVSRIDWIDTTAPGQISSKVEAFNIAKERGLALKELGFNMNFAPVAEQAQLEHSFIHLQGRAYKSSDMVISTAVGYSAADVIPVVKHFPGGLGRIEGDPHEILPEILLTEEEFQEDMEPFRQAVEAGVAMVMVTHLSYPQYDPDPVSASNYFMNTVLREELGFAGVIVVDDLSMGAVVDHYDVDDYAVKSVLHGADLMLVSDFDDYEQVYAAMVENYQNDPVFAKRVDESVVRIVKQKLRL